MKVGYFYNPKVEFPPVGTQLTQCNLKIILNTLPKLPKNHKKHMVGTMYFHTNNVVGVEFNPVSTGIVCCDIDKIEKDDCKKIVDNFDKLSLVFPCLVSCWYSHSYYNKPYGGLHLVIKTNKSELRYDEFAEHPDNSYRTQNMIYSAALAYYIYDVCGVDVRPKYSDKFNENSGLDKVMLRIGQQCFLNYSEIVKWNDNIYDVAINNDTVNGLKKWFIGYKWFDNEDDFKTVSCNVAHFDYEKILSDDFKPNTSAFYKENQLGHDRRIAVENFLASLGWDQSSIVNFMMKICFGDDFKNGEAALRKAVIQTTKVAIRKYKDKPNAYAERARSILTALGVDIELEIERIYQPIEDKSLESLFEEVWLEEKDKLPENYLKVHLKEGEYLSDHEDTITPMIKKYTMTYLNLDCAGGKSTYALKMIAKEIVPTLFDDSFVMMVKGNSVDLCVPYNSVADDKSKGSRKDVKRLKTQCITDFDENKRNVFIWNTVMPMYEKYFNLGTVKRLVLFFDESQKIVTDDYRWETVFDMFKVLPVMYKHFVFMTGTPAYEHEFLLQYFPDWCCINITNESPYKKSCNILKYKQFGNGDRVNLIESEIAEGRLPLIYSNTKNDSWKQAVITINKNRVESGLRPLRVLEFDRPNAENLGTVMNTNSIKDYDVVIATKYCSVGIDFMKDDDRVRCSIVDYANENDCCFHDIWQFAARNRLQDMMIKIIARDDDKYYKKLPTISRIERLCKAKATLHTTGDTIVVNDENDIVSMHNVLNDIFKERKFGRLIKRGFFNDLKNVTLLESYYKYVLIFSNMNMIKHMLIRRGVELTETEMEHAEEKIDMSYKKEIYEFFVDNFDDISRINDDRCGHDKMSYKIPINDNRSEYMQDNKIYTRNTAYTNWLIRNFAGREEWIEILKDRDYISKEMFAAYTRISMIADKLDKKQIKLLKTLKETIEDIEDIDMVADLYDSLVLKLVRQHYDYEVDVNNRIDREEYEEVLTDYKKILQFAVDNIEYIEDIRNTRETGERMTAIHKMKITMEQKDNERRINKISKTKSKKYTVKFKNGVVKTFNGQQEMMQYFKVSKRTIVNLLNGENCKISKNINEIRAIPSIDININ